MTTTNRPDKSLETIAMTGPAGEVVINAKDRAAYEKDGYKVCGEEPVEEAAPYDFTQHKVDQLREMAEQAGIEGFADMNRNALLDALAGSGWTPPE